MTRVTGMTLLFASVVVVILAGVSPQIAWKEAVVEATGPTPTPFAYHALYSEQDAIDRAMGLFPEGKNPGTAIARLRSRLSAVAWRMGATPQPGEYDSTRLSGPSWIVGIPGTGLTACDIAPRYTSIGGLGAACNSTQSIFGVYYVLDPSNAMPITIGELTQEQLLSLDAMTNDSFTISAETPETLGGTPVVGTQGPAIVTSTPEP